MGSDLVTTDPSGPVMIGVEVPVLVILAAWGVWQVYRDRTRPSDIVRRLDAQARHNINHRNHEHNRIEQP